MPKILFDAINLSWIKVRLLLCIYFFPWHHMVSNPHHVESIKSSRKGNSDNTQLTVQSGTSVMLFADPVK